MGCLELDENGGKYWHSHKYVVDSGKLVQVTKSLVPKLLAKMTEMEPLQVLVNTYDKTFQFWHVDKKCDCSSLVPTAPSPSQLLVSLTEGSQIDLDLLAKCERMLGISTLERRQDRQGAVQGHPRCGRCGSMDPRQISDRSMTRESMVPSSSAVRGMYPLL